jgi:sugar lactone lactonase YvrE
VVRIVGAPGTGPGFFFYPRALAVNDRGEMCVADRSGRIQCFDREGALLVSFELPLWKNGQPTGLNFARSGDLMVADSHYHRVLVYGPPAERAPEPPPLKRTFGTEGAGDGQFSLVRDIVEDSHGFLYAGDYDGPQDRIEKFTAQGDFVMAFGKSGTGDGELQRPQGLAIERRRDGEFLLVADACNHRIQRFTLDGKFVSTFGALGSGRGELKYPYGLTARGPGEPGGPGIYVVEWGNNRIQRFDPDGHPTGMWGQPGRGPGQFSTPWDVTLGPEGRIFVTDYGNHRVQVLESGTLD